jgi:hypothetical protein
MEELINGPTLPKAVRNNLGKNLVGRSRDILMNLPGYPAPQTFPNLLS